MSFLRGLFPRKWVPPPPEPPVIEEIQDERVWQQKWLQVAQIAWAKGLFLCSDRRWRHLPKRFSRPFTLGATWSLIIFGASYIAILTYAANPDLILPSVLFAGGCLAIFFVTALILANAGPPAPEVPYPPNPVARITRFLFALWWRGWLLYLVWQVVQYLRALPE